MNKLFISLTLISLSPWAAAQAPAFEPMPEGSRDAFFGLGLGHRPSYEGSNLMRWQLEPQIQIAWSSGLFISGTQLGWHLGKPAGDADHDASDLGHWEWGPLLSLQAGRNEQGRGWFVDSPGALATLGNDIGVSAPRLGTRLQGMESISAGLDWGAFLNFSSHSRWRLTQSLLSGRGRGAQTLRWSADMQYALPSFAAHHSLSWSVGMTWSNAAYNRLNFGVTGLEAARTAMPAYSPDAGLSEVRTQLRWNWAMSPQWLLSTALQFSQLRGPAKGSPLVERASASSLSTALVYRF